MSSTESLFETETTSDLTQSDRGQCLIEDDCCSFMSTLLGANSSVPDSMTSDLFEDPSSKFSNAELFNSLFRRDGTTIQNNYVQFNNVKEGPSRLNHKPTVLDKDWKSLHPEYDRSKTYAGNPVTDEVERLVSNNKIGTIHTGGNHETMHFKVVHNPINGKNVGQNNSKLKKCTLKLQELTEENRKLQENCASALNELHDKNKKLKKEQAKNVETDLANKELERKTEALKVENDSLKVENDSLKKKAPEAEIMKQQFKKMEKNIHNEWEEKKNGWIQKTHAQDQKIDELGQRCKDYEHCRQQKDLLEKKVKDMEAELARRTCEDNAQLERMHNLEKEMEKVKNALTSSQLKCRNERRINDTALNKISALEEEIETMRADVASATADRDETRRLNEGLRRIILEDIQVFEGWEQELRHSIERLLFPAQPPQPAINGPQPRGPVADHSYLQLPPEPVDIAVLNVAHVSRDHVPD